MLYTTGRPDLLEGFLREGHDPKYIGTPMPIETFMHRDWETFTRKACEPVPRHMKERSQETCREIILS